MLAHALEALTIKLQQPNYQNNKATRSRSLLSINIIYINLISSYHTRKRIPFDQTYTFTCCIQENGSYLIIQYKVISKKMIETCATYIERLFQLSKKDINTHTY